VPENGCNGNVKLRSTNTNNGTFTQTSTNNYNVTLSLIYNCTASITLGTVMTMDCPSCEGIQIIRGGN
jgi:hypothetical protein